MSPTLRRRPGRQNTGCQDSQKNSGVEPPDQAPKTPPLMQKRATLKRRRSSSSPISSPSKAPRQINQDGSSDTERGPMSDSADIVDAESSCRFDNPHSSNNCSSPIAAEVTSPGPPETKENPAGPSTPDKYDSLCEKDDACLERYNESFLRPDPSEDHVPDMSPDTYIYVRNLGLQSPDGSFPEHWANYPVSFIPSTSPWGPRDLEAGRYNCLYPGCVNAFGPSGQLDGYTGRGLALHIYGRHGHGPAVDLVRLDLHKRIMTLRAANGVKNDDTPLPCSWKYPGRDLKWITAGLIKDLEEVRGWERARGVGVRKTIKADSLARSLDTDQPAVTGTEESVRAINEDERVGKQKAVTLRADSHDLWDCTDSLENLDDSDIEANLQVASGSPSIRARTNFCTRSRNNRFQRPRGATLLHLKEVCRTPKKERDEPDSSRERDLVSSH